MFIPAISPSAKSRLEISPPLTQFYECDNF